MTLTGGSSDYYRLTIKGTTIECNDIIKGLKLNYALGNILKAVWRIGMSHLGKGKPGTTTIYDAEKIVFFGEDQLGEEKKAEASKPLGPIDWDAHVRSANLAQGKKVSWDETPKEHYDYL